MSAVYAVYTLGGDGAEALNVADLLAATLYIGPGSGMAAFGSLIAVIAAGALVAVGFVWYPVRRVLRARRAARERRATEGR